MVSHTRFQSWQKEDSQDSIKPGNVSNLTILEQKPYEVDIDQLKDIAVSATVFEGKIFRWHRDWPVE